jgi:lysyl-tRNA synthetase class 2
MQRDQFLERVWKAYPSPSESTQSMISGRVLSTEKSLLVLKSEGRELTFEKNLLSIKSHHDFGAAVPVNCLRRGDWVSLDPDTHALYLLSPCLSLDDQELKDFKAWDDFLRKVDQYFVGLGFQAIQTPLLVPCPGVDHHIDFLQVEASKTQRRWTLPTSPEIHLKKALCQGHEKVFEISRCFRDDLPGEWHQVEFSMLEWYRAFAPLSAIAQDLQGLLQSLWPSCPPLSHLTVREAFNHWLNFNLRPDTSMEELRALACKHEVDTAEDDDWNDLFFRIFMDKIEPHLGKDGPELIHRFPPTQASLSQVSPEGWSERFELYWQGVELANAYLEVNDPEENRARFRAEQELREAKGVSVAQLDLEFFDFLQMGMPPASGVALGLDRLFKLIKAL